MASDIDMMPVVWRSGASTDNEKLGGYWCDGDLVVQWLLRRLKLGAVVDQRQQ